MELPQEIIRQIPAPCQTQIETIDNQRDSSTNQPEHTAAPAVEGVLIGTVVLVACVSFLPKKEQMRARWQRFSRR